MRKESQTQVFDIPIPQTDLLEQMVLADAIAAPELLGDIIPAVSAEYFTTEERRAIWEGIVERYNKGEQIGTAMVTTYPAMMTEVAPYLVNAGMADTLAHVQNLRDGAAKRRAYFTAARFIQDAIRPTTTEQDILSSVEGFSRAIEGPAPIQGEKALATVIDAVKEEIHKTEKAANAGRVTRVTTGFKDLDTVLNGGLKGGQLVILAARPSVGKTALMLQMAKAAAQAGNPAQVFSLEMTSEELAERVIFSTDKVRPYDVTRGCMDWRDFEEAEKQLRPLPFYINDFSRSLDEIVSRLTQAVKKGRCKVAFIDYLGLLNDCLNFGGNAKLYQVIARVTGTLKAVAKRLEIPIVLLCQINRESAKENRPPQLYDLRDSGSIEQDADVVLMLDSKIVTENRLYVWLRKNRAGKKEIAFVLEPNRSYTAFTQVDIVVPDNTPLPEPPKPVQGDLPMEDEDEDEYTPF